MTATRSSPPGSMLRWRAWALKSSDGHIEAVCPWATASVALHQTSASAPWRLVFRMWSSMCPQERQTESLAFIRRFLGAQAAPLEDAQGRSACVTAGTGQKLLFRETDRPTQPYDQHHIQIYINDFSGPHRRLAAVAAPANSHGATEGGTAGREGKSERQRPTLAELKKPLATRAASSERITSAIAMIFC